MNEEQKVTTPRAAKRHLPLVESLAEELSQFEQAERARLGLTARTRPQWRDHDLHKKFTKRERIDNDVTILFGGLTLAHDYLVEGALRGLGYKAKHLPIPDNAALERGKELGNRGQCNPTYYTVGNLIRYLDAQKQKGMSVDEIVAKHVHFSPNACGPCRFGMYATEYRKALREAGYPGFRVLSFQQQGGLNQAGDDEGLELSPRFFLATLQAILAGDVINALGYRIRPYERVPGETDKALERIKARVYDALVAGKSVLFALLSARRELGKVAVDYSRVKPKVSIIGEFWAMTTEGDGNYQLTRFLESEGAEVTIQVVTDWLLYNIWEVATDTRTRRDLRGEDGGRLGLAGLASTGPFAIQARLVKLTLAKYALHAAFQTHAFAAGLRGYHLSDMDVLADKAHEHYHTDLRGGEGHMEVAKLMVNVQKRKAHLTLSVKPFGCMPSAAVSDGIQPLVVERLPSALFCAVETSGDGKVNFYSRVQMFLFKAKREAAAEFQRLAEELGVEHSELRQWAEGNPSVSALRSPDAHGGSTAEGLLRQAYPELRMSPWERRARTVRTAGEKCLSAATASRDWLRSAARDAAGLWPLLQNDLAAMVGSRPIEPVTQPDARA